MSEIVISSGKHPAVELDIAAQIEAVRDVVEVAEDFGLAGILFGPLPFLFQFG